MSHIPTPDNYTGLTVAFMLNEGHVAEITKKRIARGTANYSANGVADGQVVAGVIVRDWFTPLSPEWIAENPDKAEAVAAERSLRRAVNIRLLLDGTDDIWVTSAQMFDPDIHVSMLNPEGERTNVYVHGQQNIEYWLNAGYTEPEADARGHWWIAGILPISL